MSSDRTTLSVAEAQSLATDALTACNTARDNAAATALALVLAEVDGQAGHGLSRVPSYALQAKAGKVNGVARPKLTRTADAVLRVDAEFGFAYPALDRAIAELIPMARQRGIAAAGLYRSHHFGQAGQHVERLADEGLVAIAFSNTPKAMAFHGAARPMLGTNPVAFAAPIPQRAPLVIDLSLSVAARGKIVAAQSAGQEIPMGWAVNAAGEPTSDPNEALRGSLLPIGNAKGAALALMIEVLCGAVAGGAFGWEASSLFDDKDGPPNLGQVLIALDPQVFAGNSFLPRMKRIAENITDSGARLPGDRRLVRREHARTNGLTIPTRLYEEIRSLLS